MGKDPASWLVPDVSITHGGQPGEEYLEGAPLVAIEVASDTQSAAHLEAKAGIYLAHGCREVWLIYPKTRHIWIHRAGQSTIEHLDAAIRSELLPGAQIPFDQIF